jgi:hypothetical protein
MIEQNRYTKSEIFAWPFRTNIWLFRVNIRLLALNVRVVTIGTFLYLTDSLPPLLFLKYFVLIDLQSLFNKY